MTFFSPHGQDKFPDWDSGISRAAIAGRPFPVFKAFWVEALWEIQGISPETHVVFRQWADAGQQGRWIEMVKAGRAIEAADEFIDTFYDSVSRVGVDWNGKRWVGSINEEYPTHDIEKLKAAVGFDMAFINRLITRLPGVRPVVFTAAVGNPDYDEFKYLLPLMAASKEARGEVLWGYHGYWTVKDKVNKCLSDQIYTDLPGRWEAIDGFAIDNGYSLLWYLDESAATYPQADNGYSPDGVSGWRSQHVWDGDLEGYLEDMSRMEEIWLSSPAAQTGRLLGAAIFTSKTSPGTWDKFNLIGGDYLTWVDWHIASDPPPVPFNTTPPPPPEPTTLARGIDLSHWNGTVRWERVLEKGIAFSYFKASQGASFKDGRYSPYMVATAGLTVEMADGKRVPFLRGPYHFFTPLVDAGVQLSNMVQAVQGAASLPELPWALDVEQRVDTPLYAVRVLEMLRGMRQVSGRMPVLYTSPAVYNTYLKGMGIPWSDFCYLWIAHWDVSLPTVPDAWEKWTIWQTGKGKGADYGIQSSEVDLNVFRGSHQALLEWAGYPPEPPPPPTPEPREMVITTHRANLRVEPKWSGVAPIVTLPVGTELEYDGDVGGEAYNGSSIWVKVKYLVVTDNNQLLATGYIHSTLVK